MAASPISTASITAACIASPVRTPTLSASPARPTLGLAEGEAALAVELRRPAARRAAARAIEPRHRRRRGAVRVVIVCVVRLVDVRRVAVCAVQLGRRLGRLAPRPSRRREHMDYKDDDRVMVANLTLGVLLVFGVCFSISAVVVAGTANMGYSVVWGKHVGRLTSHARQKTRAARPSASNNNPPPTR